MEVMKQEAKIKTAKLNVKALAVALGATVATIMPSAVYAADDGWLGEVKSAVQSGFNNAQTIAVAIVIGFAAIYAVKLAMRLIK